MLAQSVHWCEGCDQLDPGPLFFVQEAYDTRNDQKFEMVMVALPTSHGSIAVHVDFCPWCGVQLTTYRTFFNRAQTTLNEQHDYLDYRKRFVKQGRAGMPMEKDEWETALAEYNETEMLLPYAKPEHQEGLFSRKQVLRDRLALGVTLRMVPPALPGESAEDYVRRLHRGTDETTDI